MKKVLVLATDYSDNQGKVMLHYIHTRNLEYVKQGIDVKVLNFSSNEDYVLDGIKVITLENFMKSTDNYDVVISHAPNVRNHYRFLTKYNDKFKKFFIFFHGHEVLRMSEAYPKPYSFTRDANILRRSLRDLYDTFKFRIWRNFFIHNSEKIVSIFVSEWMMNEFLKNTKLSIENLKDHHIIYNSIGEFFEDNYYSPENIQFDYITIRSSLDGSKYGIDLVKDLALAYPDKKFLVIGRGDFFHYIVKPDNITLIDKQLSHQEIISYLNQSRFALLPTRTDSQGVMACEMISYGIPLITSSINVCEEIFGDVYGVYFIDNSNITSNTLDIVENDKSIVNIKTDKFNKSNTVNREIELLLMEVDR